MFSSRKIFLIFGFLYLLFVVYGSLVPFDFHPRPLEGALKDFIHIRYLKLGAASRADWVANLLLYIPLPYLWLGALSREKAYFTQVALSIFFFCFFVALAVAVEFAQLFFPPRTVSLNDIIAEVIGTAGGIVIWWSSGTRVRDLFETVLSQGRRAAYAALILYAAGYLAFSLFPYDFLISAQEIDAKLSGHYFHWLASSEACGATLRCGAKLFAEAAAVAPVGFLVGLASRNSGPALIRWAAWIGFWLGLVIETLQFFLVSGVSLGASILTRVLGVSAGAFASERLKRASIWPLLYLLRPFVPIAGAAYVLLAAAVAWSGKGSLLRMEDGLNRIQEIHFMPFYYHYYTSESAAMTSLLGNAVMFFPLGVLYWIWHVTELRDFVARGTVNAFLLSSGISSIVEIGKLFFSSARPDPTNVLIGALAGAVGFLLISICARSSLNFGLLDEDDGAHVSGGRRF